MTEKVMRLERVTDKLNAISHPCRLCIVEGLRENSCNVTQIQELLGIPQPSVSAHLSKLRSAGIISGKRRGQEIIYELIDHDTANVVLSLQD